MSTQPLVAKVLEYRNKWSDDAIVRQALISFNGLKPEEADNLIRIQDTIRDCRKDGLTNEQIKSFLKKEYDLSATEADDAIAPDPYKSVVKPNGQPAAAQPQAEGPTAEDEHALDDLFGAPAPTEPGVSTTPVLSTPAGPAEPAVAAVVQPDANGEFPTPVDGALWMASLGIPQTPLRVRTKEAFLPKWQDKTTTNPTQIRAWAQQYPGCNFGSVGLKDHPFPFEVDSSAVRERFKMQNGDFTAKLIVESSPGKGHRYYLSALGVENISQCYTKYGDFSIRADREYCVSPGSVHPKTGKQYRVVFQDLANGLTAPTAQEIAFWNSERVGEKAKASEEIPRDAAGLIPHGHIHGYMLTQAGKLRHMGLSVERIEECLLELVHENCAPPIDDEKVKAMARSMKYEPGPNTDILLTQTATAGDSTVPIVDDPSDYDSRFDMKGDTFDTKVYEDISRRSTPYPDPGENDLISLLAKKLVTGTPIPLAYVREPLKAIVLHAIDGKVIHPAHPKLTMRGNYFSLGESETNKTTGLEYALSAGSSILTTSFIHPQDLFRYKSEQVFVRSFTPEGTIKRDAQGKVKSGRAGNSSQFLYIKEGNLVAHCSEYFGAVFSRLTDLYDQTQASTESMTGGDFEAGTAKASTVMCFTPVDYVKTFGGKGTIGGGGLSRWGIVNPPVDHSYDNKDWKPLSDKEIQDALEPLLTKAFNLNQGSPIVLIEEDGAAEVRLETKAMLRNAGKAGKRLLEYFIREQVAQAVTAVDGRLVMTTEQALYAKRWVEAQVECRLNCWPSDANNQIEAMEHIIRKVVCTHFVSETKLKDACNLYREGSGGWFTFNAARNNMVHSGAIKLTGKTRKGVKIYCPGACAVHPAVN